MSPSPGDDGKSHHDSKTSGGLASIFKGLTGAAKLTRSPSHAALPSGPSINAHVAEHLGSVPTVTRGLPQQHTEAFEQLKNGALDEQIAAAHALRSVVADYPLCPVLDIWYAAKDLIEPSKDWNARTAGWELLAVCVKHPSSSDLERKEYFQTISAPANPEDFQYQLTALAELTKHGRDVSGFDYDIFPLLSTWLQSTFSSVRAARNAAKKQESRAREKALTTDGDGNTDEHGNFAGLFAFITDVIKFNFIVANDEAAGSMIDVLVRICLSSSFEEDLRACIGVLEAIVTFGSLPADKLNSCVLVLSSIHAIVHSLRKKSWHTISMLCRSHNGQAIVRILLEVMISPSADTDVENQGVREVLGVVSVLTKLISKSAEKGYPLVPYALLVDGLSKVVEITSQWRVHVEILRLVNALLCDAEGKVDSMLTDEDWTPIFDIAVASSAGLVTLVSRTDEDIIPRLLREEVDNARSLLAKELMKMVYRLENILKGQQSMFIQRQACIDFFIKVHPVVPDSVALLILDYFREFRCCFPTDAQWETNLGLVLDTFFTNKKRSTEVRLQALHNITEVYDMVELVNDQVEPEFVPRLVKRLLAGVAEERDVLLLQDIVSFAVTVATATSYTLFCHIMGALRGIVGNGRLRLPGTPPVDTGVSTSLESAKSTKYQTPSSVVTRGYVQIFLRVMNLDVAKATRLFHSLVSIAKSTNSETDARVTAMQLLFRLRADWARRIFVTPHTETDSLATTLNRTEDSISRKLAEETSQPTRLSRADLGGAARSSRGVSFSHGQTQDRAYPLRSASGSKPVPSASQALWFASDPDALPEVPSPGASPVLYSGRSDAAPGLNNSPEQESILPMGLWLDTVLNLIQQKDCDWEVYSFVLVHLPSQLSNHAIFESAVPQLQELRKTVCDQIRLNSFDESQKAPLGVRRGEIAICLFHTLTMILSYHRYFQKAEEDEIVRTFVHGIVAWERSAKCCIHALTICCHELPSSTSKALVTILQRMAQIITQPAVAMHILEFLACLSRLPSLYVNFREDEYRIVFGISFRYLQYVRGRKQNYRSSSIADSNPAAGASSLAENQAHSNASDDLPQYVYTLAYHIVLFWFLALRLPDRANHVGWIAKNLFTDVDGSQVADEQAQITIDFMQRVAYADIDESAADPLFTADRFGEILKKRWLIGNSIVTVEQAVTTGWAQITKRQPSGTSCYTIRELFRPPPAHQQPANDMPRDSQPASTNSVLPSHLLVQLLSSMPQGSDAGRPVPLPEDDAVDRAIRVFDHNSTVDGHKVGVIYIGEDQTNESEILANVSGSRDYVEFLNGLGTLTKLKGATFNTQGLDRQYDTDGEYTFCWRDRVTELVFHVTTQMPTNLNHDPQCTLKKRHIGNDFVNIIFNDSGFPFKFDTFPSEFNFVNIVITPESRASFVATRQRTPKDVRESFYQVHVLSEPGFPEISPASEPKIVSLKALPDFIRLLALNASVFALVWANREGGEHISPWRNRLREINRLREKYSLKYVPTPSPPGTAMSHGNAVINTSLPQLEVVRPGNTVRDSFTSLRRSSVATFFSNSSEQNSHRSSMLSTAPTDNTEVMTSNGLDSLVDSVDFSKWA
ncbi:Uu.00g084980.m01.CDS01 [Anthostomella pinea]|uniref:Uu.00g084980.m01.CDS01 n=1 Tax=Anthostomella pinea TaxID=933095 RepID=A0AAI8VMH5_9PEZI|nr:Uu.00g084980.m01.CDS01 [Anthostomella pinea]